MNFRLCRSVLVRSSGYWRCEHRPRTFLFWAQVRPKKIRLLTVTGPSLIFLENPKNFFWVWELEKAKKCINQRRLSISSTLQPWKRCLELQGILKTHTQLWNSFFFVICVVFFFFVEFRTVVERVALNLGFRLAVAKRRFGLLKKKKTHLPYLIFWAMLP